MKNYHLVVYFGSIAYCIFQLFSPKDPQSWSKPCLVLFCVYILFAFQFWYYRWENKHPNCKPYNLFYPLQRRMFMFGKCRCECEKLFLCAALLWLFSFCVLQNLRCFHNKSKHKLCYFCKVLADVQTVAKLMSNEAEFQ